MRTLSLIASTLVAGALLVGAPADAAAKKKQKVTASETFVELPAISASVVHDFSVRALLQVEIGLDIQDARLRREAERMEPRLRAACAAALRAYTGDQYAYGRLPDLERLTSVIQAAVDEALNESGAEVILGMVIVHQNPR